jgi:hypothetical protein
MDGWGYWGFPEIFHLCVQLQRRTHKGELNYHCPNKEAREDLGAFEEKLKELADILLNGNGWSSFSIGVASSGDLDFPFMVVGWRTGCWGPHQQSGACAIAATFVQTTKGHWHMLSSGWCTFGWQFDEACGIHCPGGIFQGEGDYH